MSESFDGYGPVHGNPIPPPFLRSDEPPLPDQRHEERIQLLESRMARLEPLFDRLVGIVETLKEFVKKP